MSSEPIDEGKILSDRIEALSNPELSKLYLDLRRTLRDLIKRAKRISVGSGGIPSTSHRMFWASVLFTRILIISKSVDRLLPDPRPREHWDFSSVASLARNLQEAVLVYAWLCAPGIAEEVRAGRFILLELHDHGSRRRIFPPNFPEPEDDPVFQDLQAKFDGNSFLATFNAKQRREALRGEKTPFIQDDMLAELGIDPESFRTMYRFFSQHTHTGPISFYRMRENVIGVGVETRLEKQYMIIAITAATEALKQAIEVHIDIFPDAETRTPHLTDRQVEMKVEHDQGRRRGKRGPRA